MFYLFEVPAPLSPSFWQLEKREKRASVGVAFSLILLAVVVAVTAIVHLADTDHEVTGMVSIAVLCGPSAAVLVVLAACKLRVGILTRSASLKKDAACSLSGALLSIGALAGAAAADADSSLSYVDGVIALVVCSLLLLFGLVTLVKNCQQGNSWWRLSWWLSSSVSAHTKMGVADNFSSPAARKVKAAATRRAPSSAGGEPTPACGTPSDSSDSSPGSDASPDDNSRNPYEP